MLNKTFGFFKNASKILTMAPLKKMRFFSYDNSEIVEISNFVEKCDILKKSDFFLQFDRPRYHGGGIITCRLPSLLASPSPPG